MQLLHLELRFTADQRERAASRRSGQPEVGPLGGDILRAAETDTGSSSSRCRRAAGE